VDNLQQQYDSLQGNINQIDTQIQQNQIQMDRLQAASIITDRNGNTINLPLPQVYYDLQADNQRLTTQKAGLVQQQNGLRDRAAQVQQGLPVPKFTGAQQIIGVDGVPIRDTSANAPTTTPSAADATK
jgi:Tfp pilus assembly protein FimV